MFFTFYKPNSIIINCYFVTFRWSRWCSPCRALQGSYGKSWSKSNSQSRWHLNYLLHSTWFSCRKSSIANRWQGHQCQQRGVDGCLSSTGDTLKKDNHCLLISRQIKTIYKAKKIDPLFSVTWSKTESGMRNYLFTFYFGLKMIQSVHIFLYGQNSFISVDTTSI